MTRHSEGSVCAPSCVTLVSVYQHPSKGTPEPEECSAQASPTTGRGKGWPSESGSCEPQTQPGGGFQATAGLGHSRALPLWLLPQGEPGGLPSRKLPCYLFPYRVLGPSPWGAHQVTSRTLALSFLQISYLSENSIKNITSQEETWDT